MSAELSWTQDDLKEIASRVLSDAQHEVRKAEAQVTYCDLIAISRRGNRRSSKEQHAILSLAMNTLSGLDEDIEFFSGQGADIYFSVLDLGIDGPQAIREKYCRDASRAGENLRQAIRRCIAREGLRVLRVGEFRNAG